MNVLVACEESQRVATAFREKGHIAFSCDIQECSGGHPEYHIKEDVAKIINGCCTFSTMTGDVYTIPYKWDLIIAHPPCTFLSKAGANRLTINGKLQENRYKKGIEAANFFNLIYNADCDKICVENPVPLKIFGLPIYSQIIQPYMFGDAWKKTTCLWLKGLPLLIPDNIVEPLGLWINARTENKYPNKGVINAKERSKTFPGIARAMAEQWGDL